MSTPSLPVRAAAVAGGGVVVRDALAAEVVVLGLDRAGDRERTCTACRSAALGGGGDRRELDPVEVLAVAVERELQRVRAGRERDRDRVARAVPDRVGSDATIGGMVEPMARDRTSRCSGPVRRSIGSRRPRRSIDPVAVRARDAERSSGSTRPSGRSRCRSGTRRPRIQPTSRDAAGGLDVDVVVTVRAAAVAGRWCRGTRRPRRRGRSPRPGSCRGPRAACTACGVGCRRGRRPVTGANSIQSRFWPSPEKVSRAGVRRRAPERRSGSAAVAGTSRTTRCSGPR